MNGEPREPIEKDCATLPGYLDFGVPGWRIKAICDRALDRALYAARNVPDGHGAAEAAIVYQRELEQELAKFRGDRP